MSDYVSSIEELFDQQQGESAEKLAEQKALVEGVIGKLSDDQSAWCTDDFISALAGIFDADRQMYQRFYYQLKAHRVATDVDKAIKVFRRRNNKRQNPTLPAPPALARLSEVTTLHSSYTSSTKRDSKDTPTIKKDALVTDDDDGRVSIVIESEGATIMAESLRGFAAYDDGAKTWFVFNGAHWAECNIDQIDSVLIGLLYQGAATTGFTLSYKNNIRGLLTGSGFLPMPKAAKGLLPFINGILDLKTQTLHPPTPDTAQT